MNRFNITQILDSPVGEHFHGHIAVPLHVFVHNRSDISSVVDLSVDGLFKYFADGSGPLSEAPQLNLYFNSKHNTITDWPDVYVVMYAVSVSDNFTQILSIYGENVNEWRHYWRPFVGQIRHLLCPVILVRQNSFGSIRLQSDNPFDAPLIDTNYYSHPRDLEVHVNGLSQMFAFMMTQQFKRYANLFPQPIPGCELCSSVAIYECLSYLRCVAQSISTSTGHLFGSCKMGSVDDELAVVDERLRVRGMRSLRVVDASIMPNGTNSNPNAAAVMIAEYGVQIIREDNYEEKTSNDNKRT